MNTAILPRPPDVGLLRACQACNRWFAMELVAVKPDATAGHIRTYRCKHCGNEMTFADRRPPKAV